MSGDPHGGQGGHDDEEHEEHEEHVNHEAWVIPYADLLTLLMAMFIALFSISNVDAEKFKALAESLAGSFGGSADRVAAAVDGGGGGGDSILAFGGTPVVVAGPTAAGPSVGGGGTGPGADGQTGQGDAADPAAEPAQVIVVNGGDPADPASAIAGVATLLDLGRRYAELESSGREQLLDVQRQIETHAAGSGWAGNLSYRLEAHGLVVTVVTDQVLFGSGSATLASSAAEVLSVIGGAITGIDNPIMVEGHTDDVPIATATFPSNWELSTARAGAVVRFFERTLGIPSGRLQAAGFGSERPIDTNGTAEGRSRNRRVEVVIGADTATLENVLKEAAGAADRVDRATRTPPATPPR